MRSDFVIIPTPVLDGVPGMFQTYKPIDVQAFIPQPAIEAFNEGVLDRLAWANEVQFDASLVSPLIQRLTSKFRTIVDGDDFW